MTIRINARTLGIGRYVVGILQPPGIGEIGLRKELSGNGLGDGEKSKTLAAIFAFLLGEFGVHKFYLGDQKWGIIHIVLTIAGFTLMFIGSMLVEIDNWLSLVGSICAISGFMCIIVVSVKCLVDCIKLLLMSEEDFQERYCSE